jgi:hypothetical protein
MSSINDRAALWLRRFVAETGDLHQPRQLAAALRMLAIWRSGRRPWPACG